MQDRNGWYTEAGLGRIKAVLRRKFFGMLDTGRPVTDAECADLLEEEYRPTVHSMYNSLGRNLRKGKHNMAKGALAPEDAAVSFV